MWNLVFETNPSIEQLGASFPESPYFSFKSLSYRETNERSITILIVRIWLDIAWALTFSVLPDCGRLKIWLVEVHQNYLGRWLWTQLLLEAEELNRENIDGCVWYLNNTNNIYSKNMFLKAGYTQFDSWRFYK